MKRRFVPILLSCLGWLLSGCPMAAQPDVAGALHDETASVANAAPIEPKADPRTVDRPTLIANARLRYGEGYSEIMGKAEPVSYTILSSPQKVTLRFQLDLNSSFKLDPPAAIWEPADEKAQVRLVYLPQGKTAAEGSYCDGTWETADDGTLVLAFPDLTIEEGELNFFLYYFTHFDEKDSKIPARTPDFHEGDLLPLDTETPFPVGAEEGSIYPLGAFETVRMTMVKKPAFAPLKDKRLLPKEP